MPVQDRPIYHRFCIWDAQPVPEDRLRRGANTCSNECTAAERKAKRAYFHALRKNQYQGALRVRLEKIQAQIGDARSARVAQG